uniref:Uncharacterized protein n=1 Tax=Anguilla anguilla TaxID=7936 RepID=A0A0E9VJL6_ANGAN
MKQPIQAKKSRD